MAQTHGQVITIANTKGGVGKSGYVRDTCENRSQEPC
jgi:hypothetical protein